jgi:hypothetical protein
MPRRTQKNRAKEDAFSKKYDSPMGARIRTKKEGAPMMGSASESKNAIFTRMIGAQPASDERTGHRRAHVGLHGAPDIYEEKPGGRRGKRGKRG